MEQVQPISHSSNIDRARSQTDRIDAIASRLKFVTSHFSVWYRRRTSHSRFITDSPDILQIVKGIIRVTAMRNFEAPRWRNFASYGEICAIGNPNTISLGLHNLFAVLGKTTIAQINRLLILFTVFGMNVPRKISLAGILTGLVLFGLFAALANPLALLAVLVASGSAVTFTWSSLGRRAVIHGFVISVVGAILAGTVMRFMMRWVALSSGLSPRFTIEGTLAIFGTGTLLSLLPAIFFTHFRRRFGPSLKMGLLYGVLLSLAGGLPMFLLVISEIAIAREPMIPFSAFLGLPILYSLVLEGTYRVLERNELKITQANMKWAVMSEHDSRREA